MATIISTQIHINASTEKVWAILTNFEAYPQWNPFIQQLSGEPKLGKKIEAFIVLPGSKGMTFKPTVLAFEEHKELRWIGHLLIPGIFDGEHKFELQANTDGTITFLHSEKFTGVLIPFMKKMLNVDTRKGFESMNIKLKELAEKS